MKKGKKTIYGDESLLRHLIRLSVNNARKFPDASEKDVENGVMLGLRRLSGEYGVSHIVFSFDV